MLSLTVTRRLDITKIYSPVAVPLTADAPRPNKLWDKLVKNSVALARLSFFVGLPVSSSLRRMRRWSGGEGDIFLERRVLMFGLRMVLSLES
jgi:hypothetical protein